MSEKKIAVACDHGGIELKGELLSSLASWGWEALDLGTHGGESVDYPDFALALGGKVAGGDPPLGLLICGTGIGMSIAANKVPGIRAALCSDSYSASMAREHNDANVLCLGARVVGRELARSILAAFLEGTFGGGRHQRRLDIIASAEPRDGADG